MRTTIKDVKYLVSLVEKRGYKVHWTCCSPEGRNRWWIGIDIPNTNAQLQTYGETREVYQWLKGILAAFVIAD